MSDIKIISLGGVRENAKNMYAVEVDDEIFILDCGCFLNTRSCRCHRNTTIFC